MPFPASFFLPHACRKRCKHSATATMPRLLVSCHASCHNDHELYPFETASSNKPFLPKVALVMVAYHSNMTLTEMTIHFNGLLKGINVSVTAHHLNPCHEARRA